MRAVPEKPVPIPYRENTYHPALQTPVITSGHFDLGRNGALIRRQSAPRKEVTEIGKRFITISREGYKNTVPIPSDLMPMLNALRSIVGRKTVDLNGDKPRVESAPHGWSVSITQLELRGCGDILKRLIVAPNSSERREIVFTDR